MVDAVFRPCAAAERNDGEADLARRNHRSKLRADSALRLRYTACSASGGGPGDLWASLRHSCSALDTRFAVDTPQRRQPRSRSWRGTNSVRACRRPPQLSKWTGCCARSRWGLDRRFDRLEDRDRNGCSKPMPRLAAVHKHLSSIPKTTSDNRHLRSLCRVRDEGLFGLLHLVKPLNNIWNALFEALSAMSARFLRLSRREASGVAEPIFSSW